MPVVRRVLAVGYPAALEHAFMHSASSLHALRGRVRDHAGGAYIIGVRILALCPSGSASRAAAARSSARTSRRPPAAAARRLGRDPVGALLMSAGGAVIFLVARPIATVTADEAVIAEAVAFIRVLAVAQPLMGIDFTLGGALRGAGDTRFPLLVVLLAFYVCRLGWAWMAAFGLHAPLVWVWLAVIGDYLARVALKGWRFRSGRWQTIRV